MDVKMFLLKLNSDLQNLVKKFQSAMKINKMQTESKWNAQGGRGWLYRFIYFTFKINVLQM